MHRDRNQNEQLMMTRESQERKPLSASEETDADTVRTPKRGRRKDLTPEKQSELQARQRAIGQELRRIFDDVAREPVPDELLELVSKIDQKRED
jgi:hypothetical protein